MTEPIRVLQVLGGTGLGGAESRTMDLYRNMDRDRVQFDFAVHNSAPDFYDEEIESLGGNIYRLPRFKMYNYFSYKRAWREFFKKHRGYSAVHGHMTSTASIYLPEAKRAGVPLAMAHARSAGVDAGLKGKMTHFLRRNLWKKADYCLACSGEAGEAVYGPKAKAQGLIRVLPNGVEVQKFRYQEEKRKALREELGLSEQFVIGHVGRFHPCKNHTFLLDVFSEVCKIRPQSALILVGEGTLMEAMRQKAETLGLLKKVHFVGQKANAADYYQAMDFFVFPSFYEGLPGTVVEAQAAGVPCLLADTITKEVAITPLVEYENLSESAAKWAEEILKRADEPRRDWYEDIKAAGFDVKYQAENMARFYETGEL